MDGNINIQEQNNNCKYCAKCGAKNEKDNEFCTTCGEKIIDNQQNNINTFEDVFCPNCGAKNSKIHQQCTSCGATLATNNISTKVNQNETAKTKNSPLVTTISIILGIVSTAIAFVFPMGVIILIIAAIASFFNEKTKTYGKTILITLGLLLITGTILLIIAMGMCFAGLQ